MRFYYKDTKGNLYNLKEKSNNDNFIPITENEYNSLLQSLGAAIPSISDEEKRINEAHEYLDRTDRKVLQYVDGRLSAEEFEPIKIKRAEAAAIINKYEKGA